ncbi:hypothetical protein BHK98_10920 [Hornefia porci]|uniref:V-type proton ATPase subunit E n=1 Tax=Hornefia porci TaxID=2652292 RepID=A0A1Q9JK44_9FIRM|nr:V-type ATP synthase subunit E family protein [Hornefia porci]OLR56531.1 hypothetical protein BHK98_10920 [Hornefia porci]
MGIEKITSKIMSEAETVAGSILSEADSGSDAIIAEAREKAEAVVSEARERGAADKVRTVNRREAVAAIDGRKLILARKQEMIAGCFDGAIGQLASMDKEKYVEFLAGIVKSTGSAGGELVFNEKDAAEIGPLLAEKLNRETEGGAFSVSDETESIRGGVLLKNGQVYVSGSIESLVDEVKGELTAEVAKVLFGE